MVRHLSLITLCSTLLVLSGCGCGDCKKAEQPSEPVKTEQTATSTETANVADLYNDVANKENKLAEAENNNNVAEASAATEAPVKM